MKRWKVTEWDLQTTNSGDLENLLNTLEEEGWFSHIIVPFNRRDYQGPMLWIISALDAG